MSEAARSAAPVRVEDVGWYLEDWSDFELTLIVLGRPIVKKNNMKPIMLAGHASIAPNGRYRAWERSAWEQLRQQWAGIGTTIPASIPLDLRVVTYFRDLRGWPDLSATFEGPQDVLEVHKRTCDLTPGERDGKTKCKRHVGAIANDRMVFDHPGSVRLLDKNNPRVELTLTPHRGAR